MSLSIDAYGSVQVCGGVCVSVETLQPFAMCLLGVLLLGRFCITKRKALKMVDKACSRQQQLQLCLQPKTLLLSQGNYSNYFVFCIHVGELAVLYFLGFYLCITTFLGYYLPPTIDHWNRLKPMTLYHPLKHACCCPCAQDANKNRSILLNNFTIVLLVVKRSFKMT